MRGTQAREAGYAYPHLDYHVSVGNFERIDQGLYRLTDVPPAEHDDLIRLSLWSRNREDQPQAVVSHESALVLHELTELLPSKVHLTVPPMFRKAAPKGCVLYKGTVASRDVEERTGFRVTAPLRTLLEVAAGGVSQEQLKKAVNEALRRGLVQRAKLMAAARKDPRATRLLRVVETDCASASGCRARSRAC